MPQGKAKGDKDYQKLEEGLMQWTLLICSRAVAISFPGMGILSGDELQKILWEN